MPAIVVPVPLADADAAAHVAAFREEMTTPRGNAPVAAPAATVGFAGEGVLRARNSERAGSASTS